MLALKGKMQGASPFTVADCREALRGLVARSWFEFYPRSSESEKPLLGYDEERRIQNLAARIVGGGEQACLFRAVRTGWLRLHNFDSIQNAPCRINLLGLLRGDSHFRFGDNGAIQRGS